jgi:hypothetical protein
MMEVYSNPKVNKNTGQERSSKRFWLIHCILTKRSGLLYCGMDKTFVNHELQWTWNDDRDLFQGAPYYVSLRSVSPPPLQDSLRIKIWAQTLLSSRQGCYHHSTTTFGFWKISYTIFQSVRSIFNSGKFKEKKMSRRNFRIGNKWPRSTR